jgi:DNA polymerase-3 subunit gamma/tau
VPFVTASPESSTTYLVLARKWRPQSFDAITGQEHVTRTLENAITGGRVHHAFLFCGARGVGKTTAARVLARALNCATGPTTTPCGSCPACLEIARGTSIDVLEIDGASNRGIDEIRELREGVAYAPQRDRHKIYIIDEVHMLTMEAFNALLKTLEEPPRHVKFIFATTEPQKIPVTILSRCQRFDFKRIPIDAMVARLAGILAEESVTVGPQALRLVARESEGSMRDALSLLDRILSFSGAEVTYEQVAALLGVADRSWLRGLLDAAIAKDTSRALGIVREAYELGVDMKRLASDVVGFLRDLLMIKIAGASSGLTDLSDEETTALGSLGASLAAEDLERMLQIVIRAAERMPQAAFPRLDLEMAMVKLCQLRPLQPIDGLLARLEALERRLQSGSPLPPPSTPPAPSGSRVAATEPETRSAVQSFDGDGWSAFVASLAGGHAALAAALGHGQFLGFLDGVLRIGFVAGGIGGRTAVERRAEVQRLFEDRLGPLRDLSFESLAEVGDTPARRREADRQARLESRRRAIEEHPALRAFTQRFDATVTHVQVEEIP